MKQTVLIMATNGVGLGHITRGLAIARELQKQAVDCEVIFLTTSMATEIIREMGFMYYYIPTIELMPKGISVDYWHQMLYEQVKQLLEIYDPAVFLYDGACPYISVISQLMKQSKMKLIWMKREGDRVGYEYLREYEKLFDCVLVPMEIGLPYLMKKERNRCYLSPVLLADRKHSYDRQKVRELFGVQSDEKLVYLQLGAGNINDIMSTIQLVVSVLLEYENLHIIFGESLIGRHYHLTMDRVKTIRSYPNYSYYNGFDMAISAAGYNTFHELLYYNIPTLFLPNEYTQKDDQVARAKRAEHLQYGLCACTREDIKIKIKQLIECSEMYMRNMKKLQFDNGVVEATAIVLKYL